MHGYGKPIAQTFALISGAEANSSDLCTEVIALSTSRCMGTVLFRLLANVQCNAAAIT